ncbi:hypothetical protein FD12_GL001847 [Lentilactobacillus rapi DSM 19907 = JCM 15042]|uniref:Uncharacterized protein n=1 Tax=Lentilactobacillus rapi DSM 19907 = JCM 15042 TaxID=1423795 RepID=A0ABR5PEA4_9LACO|nr:hypothetical protein FD12_GL001847 [Lentilactobacillus rapi DSM 19907 = JCM 15042]
MRKYFKEAIVLLWINIHLISWVLLVIAVILAFSFKDKLATIFMMITRVLYIPILLSGGFLAWYRIPRAPVSGIVKLLLGLAVIALIEISFARKSRQAGSKSLYWTLIGVFVVTTIFGFYLAGWYPIAWR